MGHDKILRGGETVYNFAAMAPTRLFSRPDYKIEPARPSLDADCLVLALSSLLLSKSRSETFAIARKRTRRNITSESLMREMLAAIDVLEEQFPQKQ